PRISMQKRIDDRLSINCIGNRLAHARILEHRVALVERKILDLRAADRVDYEVGPVCKLLESIHGQGIDGNVARALLQLQRLGYRIGNDGEPHPLQLRRQRPTERISLKHDILVDLVAHESEGTGPN